MTLLASLALLCATVPPPSPPPMEAWAFRRELAEPEALVPVPTNGIVVMRGRVAGLESYRIDVAADGKVTITAEDDEGLRRAVCYYRDRVRAGDLTSCVRKPWVKNRISRCFFGLIKRPPLNHDELMDDVDYYPDAYLDRLAREGVNGLWLTVEWRDLVETSFAKPRIGSEHRLAKLRQTVAKCARYGIKTWAFCIEPKAVSADDPLLSAHPELFGPRFDWSGDRIMCAGQPGTRRYIEESTADLFRKVPDLGGLMMISHGERLTSCFSAVQPTRPGRIWSCPACDGLEPWQLYDLVTESVVRGMRAAGSTAEFVSWLYQPHPRPEREPWVAELARHPVPDGTVLAYNFESGALRDQLGRFRNGGDYWQSYVGPSEAFRTFAAACRSGGNALGAKIQVGNSHECATVPFVPVPGLLYRKYRAMREAGVSTVLQCWYFGNYPGVMNKAAGELAYEEFSDDEDAFLLRLAAPDWGGDARLVASIWKRLSDAYAEYPLSNNMQYYGPFHAGVAWPLLPDVEMKRLGRTWKPLDAPSGDALGECLENHTLAEARILAGRMCRGARFLDAGGKDELENLAVRWRGNRERCRDISVMRALQILFESAQDVFSFYSERELAVNASRLYGNSELALAAVRRMDAIVVREQELSRKMRALCAEDSRLGFHSEAECHQFHVAKLDWRHARLDEARARLSEIASELAAGRPYPESDHEKSAPSVRIGGEWVAAGKGVRFRLRENPGRDLAAEVEMPSSVTNLLFVTLNACGTEFPRKVLVSRDERCVRPYGGYLVTRNHEVSGWSVSDLPDGAFRFSFTLSADAWGGDGNRPSWIAVCSEPDAASPDFVYPFRGCPESAGRLNLYLCDPENAARLVWSPNGRDAVASFPGEANAKGGWRLVAGEPGKVVYIPFEGYYESKGGRIESPRFKLDKQEDENTYYRLTFSAKGETDGYWWVDLYDRDGNLLPDVNSRLYASEDWRAYDVMVPAGPKAAEAVIAFVSAKGAFARDVTMRRASVEEVADWCGRLADELPRLDLAVPDGAWAKAPKAQAALTSGKGLNVVLLGDSIMNDSYCGMFTALVQKDFPKAKIRFTVAVRGSTGCWYYHEKEHFDEYVARHRPDLVLIGGISNYLGPARQTLKEVEDNMVETIRRCQAMGAEVIVCTPPPSYEFRESAEAKPFDRALLDEERGFLFLQQAYERRAAARTGVSVWDLTTAPCEAIARSGKPLDWFKRDRAHNDDRGKQLIAQTIAAYFRSALSQ